jgi:hypothetical protein
MIDNAYDVIGHARDYLHDAIELYSKTLTDESIPLTTRMKAADKILTLGGFSKPQVSISLTKDDSQTFNFEKEIAIVESSPTGGELKELKKQEAIERIIRYKERKEREELERAGNTPIIDIPHSEGTD